MYMSSLFRLLLLLGSFLGASNVFASEYYWQTSFGTYSSAPSACSDYADRFAATRSDLTSGGGVITSFDHPALAVCTFTWIQTGTSSSSTTYVHRHGDSCPSGSNYNSSRGSCDPIPDLCADKAGQTTNFFAKAPPGQSSLSGEYVCVSGCRAAWSGECGTNESGQSACWGLATYTGSQCQAGDAASGSPPSPDDPDIPTCGPGYAWSGTTCVPVGPDDPDEPCEGDDCPDEPCEGDDCPDEPCEGDDCPDEPCEGDDCPDDGGDDGGDDSGGDDSGGDTGKDDSGQPCNPSTDANCTPCNPSVDASCASAVSGDQDCKVELNCKGDAIQCAILRSQKLQSCQYRWDPQIESQVASVVSGPQFELEEKTIPVANLFNEAVTKGRWLNATCPPPKTYSLKGQSIEMSFQPLCDFASALGPLIVAFASISFALIIGKGLKGN